MRNLVALPSIAGLTPNVACHCVLSLPLGMTYDNILFQVTNVTAAQMTNFKIKIGSTTVVDLDSFQTFEDLNTYYKRKTQAGFLTYWFYRPEWQEDARALCCLGTSDLAGTPITVEWDLPAIAAPAIVAYAQQRAPQPIGLITKIKMISSPFSSSGKMVIDNIPRNNTRITAIHLRKTAGDVSACDLEVNNGYGAALLLTGTKALYELNQKQMPEPATRLPVTATYTHIDLNLLGDLAGPMPTQQLVDMRLKPTIDTAGTVTSVIEYIDPLRNL